MIRFSDVQAAQLADFFDQLYETVSSVNDFIDAASSGPTTADKTAQLRAQTASIREKAATRVAMTFIIAMWLMWWASM